MPKDADGKRALCEAALLIALAMLVTFISHRLYLHLLDPNSDLFIAG